MEFTLVVSHEPLHGFLRRAGSQLECFLCMPGMIYRQPRTPLASTLWSAYLQSNRLFPAGDVDSDDFCGVPCQLQVAPRHCHTRCWFWSPHVVQSGGEECSCRCCQLLLLLLLL